MFNTIFNGPKIENSVRKAIFSNQLSKSLSKTKEFKSKKLLKEIPISQPEIAHTNNTWIEKLDLTENDNNLKQPRSIC